MTSEEAANAAVNGTSAAAPEGAHPFPVLEKLVGIASPSGQEAELATAMEAMLTEQGFAVERHEVAQGRFNLLAEKGPAEAPAILFTGHIDTVPAPAGYEANGRDPLKVEYDQEKHIYRGLGVADMKGGLAAIFAGVDGLEPRNSRIKIALCVDEEADSLGVTRLIEQRRDWFADVRLIVSGDTGAVPYESRSRFPSVLFIAGRLGRFALEILVHGPKSHAAHTDPTRNALMEAGRLLVALEAHRAHLTRKHDFLGRSDFVVHLLDGGVGRATYDSPEVCRVGLHWLALPEDTPEMVRQRLQHFVDEMIARGRLRNADAPAQARIVERQTPYASGFATPRFGPMMELAGMAYTSALGIAPQFTMGRSVGDENFFCDRFPEIPLVNFGPKGGDVHTEAEWLDADALIYATQAMREMAQAFDTLGQFKPYWNALDDVERNVVRELAEAETDSLGLDEAGIDAAVAETLKRHVRDFLPTHAEAESIALEADRLHMGPGLKELVRQSLAYLDAHAVPPEPVAEAPAFAEAEAIPAEEMDGSAVPAEEAHAEPVEALDPMPYSADTEAIDPQAVEARLQQQKSASEDSANVVRSSPRSVDSSTRRAPTLPTDGDSSAIATPVPPEPQPEPEPDPPPTTASGNEEPQPSRNTRAPKLPPG